MSWWRALVVGLLVTIVATVMLVVVPDALVSMSGMARGRRVLLATAWFTMAIVAMAWTMRRLQRAHVV